MPGHMTEKKAKEILDFLARKTGNAEFKLVEHFRNFSLGQLQDSSKSWVATVKYESFVEILWFKSSNRMILAVKSKDKSYAKVLDEIFKLSKDGIDIRCLRLSRHDARRNIDVFLPACSSLEEILVEMDLGQWT